MKEATGELNSTVIVIISVGVLATFFFSYLWPMIHNNFQKQADCNRATCDCSEKAREGNEGYCSCTASGVEGTFRCVYKG